MHFSQALMTVLAALGVGQVAGYYHGELDEFNGQQVRWQQLAKGFYTGVPADKWDEQVHVMSNVEWDVDELIANHGPSHGWPGHGGPGGPGYNGTHPGYPGRPGRPHGGPHGPRNLDLESRNLVASCQAVVVCVKNGGKAKVIAGWNAFIAAASSVSYGKVMEFLNQPFVANAAGVAVAGVISGQINEATKKECSTSGSQEDTVSATINIPLATDPGASSLSVVVHGPSGGSWTISLQAGEEGTKPPAAC